ncbi:DUF1707 domain-containing protein [Streptosporangium sp. NPDC023615]|uniref:DUF1707 SHOCT-like domain-containing protein n=1 Tax=Streptosporangium sp. NPDC023615 TaxID=3154794 RepID=UPI0034453896
MPSGPEMRASDGDRDKVASVLREHYAQGRLTTEEFDERLEQLYTSKTYGELATLTSDLPEVDLRSLPETPSKAPQRATPAKSPSGADKGLGAAWAAWGMASGINWMIWLIIGFTSGFDFPYPWPLWVMGPWGVVLLVSTIVYGVKQSQKPEKP